MPLCHIFAKVFAFCRWFSSLANRAAAGVRLLALPPRELLGCVLDSSEAQCVSLDVAQFHCG